jgi:hypothetical protein
MEKPLRIARPRHRTRQLGSLVGTTHAFLTVLEERRTKHGLGKSRFEVLVRCTCGAEKWVLERSVRSGGTQSCGSCASKTHGGSKTPEYAVWRSMLARCSNPKHAAYANYGGRGIDVCDEWRSFGAFLADMGAQPFKGASIERVDNSKGYCKDNCVWATTTEQARNRRTNRLLTVNGETKTIAEWAALAGIRHNTISYRLSTGWTPAAAVSVTPNFANRRE